MIRGCRNFLGALLRSCNAVRYLSYMSATPVAATLRLRVEQLVKLRKLAGLDTNIALADRMGFDPGNLSRILAGKQTPGPKFMASLVAAFPGFDLDDLFEVVTEDAA